MNELILFRALPGAGKTELANTIKDVSKTGKVELVSADDWMVDKSGKYDFDRSILKENHAKCRAQTEEHMQTGMQVVIVHNTFTTDWEMESYFELASSYGYKIRTVIIENRHGSENVHGVPAEHIKRMEDRFTVHLTPNVGIHTNLQDSVIECLNKLRNSPQRPDFHPEIWVYEHIAYVTGQLLGESKELQWTGLFHDLGKLETSKVNPKTGHITSYDHDRVSARYVEKFKDDIPSDVDYDMVHWLVLNHMRAKYVHRMKETKRLQMTEHEYWPAMEIFNAADDMTTLFSKPALISEVLPTLKFQFELWVKDNVNF